MTSRRVRKQHKRCHVCSDISPGAFSIRGLTTYPWVASFRRVFAFNSFCCRRFVILVTRDMLSSRPVCPFEKPSFDQLVVRHISSFQFVHYVRIFTVCSRRTECEIIPYGRIFDEGSSLLNVLKL